MRAPFARGQARTRHILPKAGIARRGFDEIFAIATDDPPEPLPIRERPTIPVPRESGIRLQVERVPGPAATVDVVVCDLSRDPRSETFTPDDEEPV